MALPILDGNQTAATLSTIITGGAHVPAHTVVSLGTQAKSDITSAISGSVVSVSNFPATQTIAGTVTANISGAVFSASSGEGATPSEAVAIGWVEETLLGANFNFASKNNPLPISGTVTVSNSTTSGAVFVKICGERNGAGSNEVREIQTDDNGFLFVNLIDPSSPSSKAVSYDPAAGGSYVNAKARLQDGSGNNLTSTSIGGVQRLNVSLASAATPGGTLPSFVNVYGGSDSGTVRAVAVDSSGRSVVTVSNFPATQAIAGTVTANLSNTVTATWKGAGGSSNAVPVVFAQEGQAGGSIISYDGSNTSLNVNVKGSLPALASGANQIGSVTVSNFPATQAVSLNSTTVTVSALPSGALTTRFGSVTTANTAQITSAVTNTSRKYLLAQNISAGTVTIGIGFSPTTTQGIQLTAGAGLTFDAFCPTGAVYWLGATTGATWTILEG